MIRFRQEQRAICMSGALSLLEVGRLRGARSRALPRHPRHGQRPLEPQNDAYTGEGQTHMTLGRVEQLALIWV